MKPTNFNFWLILIGAVFIVTIAFARYLKVSQKHPQTQTISIEGNNFEVEIADTLYKRGIGLSGHEPLKDNEGMLFVFPTRNRHSFWMKGMTFDLDIIWILDDTVAHVEERVPYLNGDGTQNLKLYKPDLFANYALEINAGLAEKLGISVGSKVETKI